MVDKGVYPRVCGGNNRLATLRAVEMGLSPRVRGKRHLHQRRPQHRRSIPACAGETMSNTTPYKICGVYPRVCGGN